MEHRDELLDLVHSYINNRNVSPSLFSNLFSTHSNNRRRFNMPQQPRNQPPDIERLLLVFNELLTGYNNNITRYQENMESLINVFRRFVPHTQSPNNLRRTTMQNPPTFYYSWVPQNQTNFENVIVSPSDEEIQRATTSIEYNSENPPINTRCPITLDNFQNGDEIIIITHCGHAFKTSAFTSWFRTNVRCPVCRYDIREYRGNHENSRPDDVDQENNSSNDISNNLNNAESNTPSSPTNPILPAVVSNDITSMVQRLISESLTTTLQDLSNQSIDENSTFMFDINLPSFIHDLSNNNT